MFAGNVPPAVLATLQIAAYQPLICIFLYNESVDLSSFLDALRIPLMCTVNVFRRSRAVPVDQVPILLYPAGTESYERGAHTTAHQQALRGQLEAFWKPTCQT